MPAVLSTLIHIIFISFTSELLHCCQSVCTYNAMRKFLFIIDTYVAKDFACTCKHVVCMPLQHYYSIKLTPNPSSNITQLLEARATKIQASLNLVHKCS